jgi:hypothetical protein
MCKDLLAQNFQREILQVIFNPIFSLEKFASMFLPNIFKEKCPSIF